MVIRQTLAPIRLIPRKKELPKIIKFITSPTLTAVLLGGAAALLSKSPSVGGKVFTGVKTFLVGGLAAGILTESAKARTFAKEKLLDPTKVGRGIGGIIEDPSKLLPKEKTVRERVKEVTKTAGLAAGVVAAGVGAVVVGKKAIEKIREAKIPSVSLPSAVLPAGLLPAEATLTSKTQPLGAVQPIEEEAIKQVSAIPSIKITNNPEINIRFSKSRSFINQQLLIR